MQSLKKNWFVVWKMTWGIWQIFTRALEKSKSWDFHGTLLSKGENVFFKTYREDMCHDNKEWCKIWEGIDLSFQNWHAGFHKFWPNHLNVLKIWSLMGASWPKYIIIGPKKYRRVMFDATEDWYKNWRKTDLCFPKWH